MPDYSHIRCISLMFALRKLILRLGSRMFAQMTLVKDSLYFIYGPHLYCIESNSVMSTLHTSTVVCSARSNAAVPFVLWTGWQVRQFHCLDWNFIHTLHASFNTRTTLCKFNNEGIWCAALWVVDWSEWTSRFVVFGSRIVIDDGDFMVPVSKSAWVSHVNTFPLLTAIVS